MKMQLFLYYGIIIDKIKLENYKNKFGMNTIYDLVYSSNLQYREQGLINDSNKYVVGKELFWDLGSNILEINNDDRMSLKSIDIEPKYNIIDNETIIDFDKSEVEINLLKLGITEKPKFYIFSSYVKE